MTGTSSQWTTYVGIDFSGAKGALSNLWSATGQAGDDGRLHITDLRPHPFREDAGAWLERLTASTPGRVLAGADFPFSLPGEAVSRIRALQHASTTSLHAGPWEAVLNWVASHPPDDLKTLGDGLMKTPRSVDPASALAPLDLRLYKQTSMGMKWLSELRHNINASVWPFDAHTRPDATLTLIEVYPSATLKDLGLRGRKPTLPAQVFARPALLEPHLTFEHPALEAAAVTLEDAWDAVLACLTAYRVRDDLDQHERIARDAAAVETEGWVYRIPDALA